MLIISTFLELRNRGSTPVVERRRLDQGSNLIRADDVYQEAVRRCEPAGLWKCAGGKSAGCDVSSGSDAGTGQGFWLLCSLIIAPIPKQL
jgi:hypothetical protein